MVCSQSFSLMKNVKDHLAVEAHEDDDPQLAADAFLGTAPYNFNYADICTDADAIKLSQMISKADPPRRTWTFQCIEGILCQSYQQSHAILFGRYGWCECKCDRYIRIS